MKFGKQESTVQKVQKHGEFSPESVQKSFGVGQKMKTQLGHLFIKCPLCMNLKTPDTFSHLSREKLSRELNLYKD